MVATIICPEEQLLRTASEYRMTRDLRLLVIYGMIDISMDLHQ